ncbi:kinase-like protein [Aspergillus steynii IBT 23096]|uniref:non-specific serine/threonine protein kinase n=1 Tax=Aspergillus steynii IBT 23096 TaxID=1392250 RepID=A0A2I2G024_9EURO|nr:kinase-like protein [Aspergillus steynii IBT 23096]PLB46176.1 kinase-like protein [Aspergillus steynii IBT 23096]
MSSSPRVTHDKLSFFEPPPFEYVPIEGVERLEGYQPGGYHPIEIGDVLQTRYRVVHKLGFGTYSTTWLCRDDQHEKYVAVKVGTGDSSSREADILHALTSSTGVSHPNHQGRDMILPVRDRFVLEGPNGVHPCYVTAPASCSVSGAKNGSYQRLFQARSARSLIAQLVMAVEYIHSRGIVHGDLHLGNILLRLPTDFDTLSVEELYAKYGPPTSEPIVRHDNQPLAPNVPKKAVLPVWLGKLCEKFTSPEVSILLSDFGEAFMPSMEDRCQSHVPIAFAPPESVFEPRTPLSYASDIWTLACPIWSILGQRPLFEGILATQDDITAEQVDVLGKLPAEWWHEWPARQECFTDDGEARSDRHARSWEDRFISHIQRPRSEAGISGICVEEKAAVLDMLRSMLAFRPEMRATARDVLKCDWMTKWALPELEEAKMKGSD